jgi:ankyrin repeat protein
MPNLPDFRGHTPLDLAIAKNYDASARLLRDAGGKPGRG